jgi:heme exporter protein D
VKEFFAMGGYAFYVWTSYALSAVVLIATVLVARRRHKDEIARIARKLKREQAKS